ncbi:9271_t:CDS:2 [Ambispora gerdemannii]|uniref:9271_t:CDS:1 n=1 Tax=Ambispora gerdemannii TaxID=144530 RepID=A0A9N9DVB2_9GLOM|nr:9271_t:CDS:2 [Ambispora gerdemannii]
MSNRGKRKSITSTQVSILFLLPLKQRDISNDNTGEGSSKNDSNNHRELDDTLLSSQIESFIDVQAQNNPSKVEIIIKSMDENVQCTTILGYVYYHGIKVDKDIDHALIYYRKAVNKLHDSYARLFLGFHYIQKEQNFPKGVNSFRKSAESGNLSGQHYLGFFLNIGHGCIKNDKVAFHWYLCSANGGNKLGQNSLAFAYETGVGTKRNKKEAFAWYRKAAENGHAKAQHKLGECYKKGMGTKKDKVKAAYWFVEAAKNDDEAKVKNDDDDSAEVKRDTEAVKVNNDDESAK